MNIDVKHTPASVIHSPASSRWLERYEQHLDQIPQLLEVMREQRVPIGAANLNERVSGGGGSATLPFREDRVDDCDDLWAVLAEYTGEVAERLQDPAPGAIGATWAVNGNPQGMPSWMNGDLAYKAGFALIAWLIDRAAEVQQLGMRDSEQHLFEMIRKLSARYTVPPIERTSRRRPCAVCGETAVVVDWVLGGAGEAVCKTCGATYSPEEPGAVA